jgi:DNA/RNA endonuclease G (NUC1)
VGYLLTADEASTEGPRINCFRADPRNQDISPTCEDFHFPRCKKPNGQEAPCYDRGHMANSRDRRYDATANINTFILTNMARQTSAFNQGIWEKLEAKNNKWAKKEDIVIIMGGILDPNDPEAVAIPTDFYRILIKRNSNGSIKDVISFLLPHIPVTDKRDACCLGCDPDFGDCTVDSYLEGKIVSIADIQEKLAAAGMDMSFLQNASAADRTKWTKYTADGLWG